MKIIFLDIDGVLNSWDYWHRVPKEERANDGTAGEFDDEAIERLNRIIEETGAVVCISSTWRILFPSTYIEQLLRKRGFRGIVIGATPSLGEYEKDEKGHVLIHRGFEIQNWLDALGDKVKSYVILDDDSDMMPGQMKNYVRCYTAHGLRESQVRQAINVLNKTMES